MKLKLSDIAEIQAGHPFRGKVIENDNSEHFVVQMKDVKPDNALGELNWQSLARTDIQGRKHPTYLTSGHTLFVARGGRNFAVYVDKAPKPAVCAQLFFLLSVKSELVTPPFLAWLINCHRSQRYFDKEAQGVTQSYAQRNITRGVLEQMPVIIPPLEKQLQIVELFNNAKKQREIMRALIDNRQTELNGLTDRLYQQFTETPK